jgi:hypothetical protein
MGFNFNILYELQNNKELKKELCKTSFCCILHITESEEKKFTTKIARNVAKINFFTNFQFYQL